MPATTPFSFVHCADLHLDSPFEGLHAVEPQIAAALRDATFRAFDNVVDLAVREEAAFLVVAGDVYDGADRSLRAQIRFRETLRRAADAGIDCLVAHGNHDPLSGWEARLAMPEGVRRFGGREVERVVVNRAGGPLAQVFGISYPVRDIKQNLASQFPRPPAGPPAIAVLHANVGGDPSHDNYAPCNLEELVAAGFDYWALGHIHARRLLREREPCIVYPGNTQGRHINEGGARGCYLVRVDDAGNFTPEFVATDVVRWFSQEVNIAALNTLDDLLDALSGLREEVRAAAQGRAAILRLQLTGRGDLHAALRRLDPERDLAQPLREGETARLDFVWLEAVHNRTRPAVDLAQMRRDRVFIGDFCNAGESLRQEGDLGARLTEELSRRPEHRLIAGLLEEWPEGDWPAILSDAETLGLDLLLGEEEG